MFLFQGSVTRLLDFAASAARTTVTIYWSNSVSKKVVIRFLSWGPSVLEVCLDSKIVIGITNRQAGRRMNSLLSVSM